MKPNPTRATQVATCSGPSSSLTPRASSTSALPQRLVAARFPCLATGWPRAATTRPAAVETLKVPAESPPVPQVSTAERCEGRGTWRACSRITRASPVTSSTVSPRRRRAVRNAPSCEGVATPVMISSIAAAASPSLRVPPATSWAIASRIIVYLHLSRQATGAYLRQNAYRCGRERPLGFNKGMNSLFRFGSTPALCWDVVMRKTFKYRLSPTKQQQRLLDQQREECRWLYNLLLAERRDAWEQRQESVRLYDRDAKLLTLKAD